MKPTTLLAILIHDTWPTFEEKLDHINKAELLEGVDWQSAVFTDPYRADAGKFQKLKARFGNFVQEHDSALGACILGDEGLTIGRAYSGCPITTSTGATDTKTVQDVRASLGAGLSAASAAEEALSTQLGAFDALRKELAPPSGDPVNITDDAFQGAAVKKMRLEAMCSHIQKLYAEAHQANARLVSLINESEFHRAALAELVRRGRAEILAQRSKGAGCLIDARLDAFNSESSREGIPASQAARLNDIASRDNAFDRLKAAAAAARDGLSTLRSELSSITDTLGRDVPSVDEFFARLCTCGCGQENPFGVARYRNGGRHAHTLALVG